MAGRVRDRFTIIIQKGNRRLAASAPLTRIDRLVFVINHQFTNAPNTTQIASGAGKSSAAGNNAAIRSPNTRQQQSVNKVLEQAEKQRTEAETGTCPFAAPIPPCAAVSAER